MELVLDKKLAANYKNTSQKIRVMTEGWVNNHIFCPNCGRLNINKHPNNQPVADFYCLNCQENFELKSKRDTLGTKIVDGAYRTMLQRLTDKDSPNFFLLNYNLANLEVVNFLVVPKHFFVPEIIERREPLASSARRAGWVGCNIILKNIPITGKIFFVHNKNVEPKEKVLATWRKTLFLREEKRISTKSWLLDVMRCIDKLDRDEFLLDDIYEFKSELSRIHPKNRHVKDKIRQQLQFLRDRGYLKFVNRGKYRKL